MIYSIISTQAGNQSIHRQLWCHVTIRNHILLAVAARNDEAVTALAGILITVRMTIVTYRSSSLSLPNNSSDDDDTTLEVNHEAEGEITLCPRAVVSVCRTIILPTNVTSVSLEQIACICESRDSSS